MKLQARSPVLASETFNWVYHKEASIANMRKQCLPFPPLPPSVYFIPERLASPSTSLSWPDIQKCGRCLSKPALLPPVPDSCTHGHIFSPLLPGLLRQPPRWSLYPLHITCHLIATVMAPGKQIRDPVSLGLKCSGRKQILKNKNKNPLVALHNLPNSAYFLRCFWMSCSCSCFCSVSHHFLHKYQALSSLSWYNEAGRSKLWKSGTHTCTHHAHTPHTHKPAHRPCPLPDAALFLTWDQCAFTQVAWTLKPDVCV